MRFVRLGTLLRWFGRECSVLAARVDPPALASRAPAPDHCDEIEHAEQLCAQIERVKARVFAERASQVVEELLARVYRRASLPN